MLFTLDEARGLKRQIAQDADFSEEYPYFRMIINLFTCWFFILTTIRSLVISVAFVSLIGQEPDLSVAWNSGYGFAFFIFYLIICALPVIGDLMVIATPFLVIISAFAVGDGITHNFVPYILPIILAYVVTFGLIVCSNYLINKIIQSGCPNIYRWIGILLGRNVSVDNGARSRARDMASDELIDENYLPECASCGATVLSFEKYCHECGTWLGVDDEGDEIVKVEIPEDHSRNKVLSKKEFERKVKRKALKSALKIVNNQGLLECAKCGASLQPRDNSCPECGIRFNDVDDEGNNYNEL